MRRLLTMTIAASALALLSAAPALACGGLVAPNGSVNLLRTSTLAAYHDGIEHYVTSFEFAGGGAKFGSIVPLPGVPSNVERGGRWTLQRLVQEVQPPVLRSAAFGAATETSADQAKVLLETQVESLDITVLEGGGFSVGKWATENGFQLSPDAPEVLDFYARRSPIFMAVRFDPSRAAADEIQEGDGIPVHVTIPTPNPWVPLRILGLGKLPQEKVAADVFLLTDREPALLPEADPAGARNGMVLERSEPASDALLADLRSDKGMEWMPSSGMWLTYLRIDTTAGKLVHDLAADVSGARAPSAVQAGLELPSLSELADENPSLWPWAIAALIAIGALSASGRLLSKWS